MYDMSGFDYDIRDIVRVLNLRVRRKTGSSYDVDCPFCGHKRGKMNVNIQKNVFRCNYCNEKGGMLDLYARLHGVSKSEANRQIREALNLGRYREDYKRPEKPEEPEIPVNSEKASDEEINHTYSTLLSLLTLSDKHREDLMRRGLTEQQIEMQRYRSVPMFGLKNLIRKLQDKGCVVQGVPGFFQDKDGKWTIHFTAKNSGILIPILSLEGLIQGFQIRLDHVTDSRKYIWLSSVNYPYGVSSGSPVHVIGNLDKREIYVTEGALKGTIAHYFSGATFICVPGVSQYKNLRPIIEYLAKRNLERVYEAYDMDKKMQIICDGKYSKCRECMGKNPNGTCPYKIQKREIIQNGCKKLYELCQEYGFPVKRLLWDTDEQNEWQGNVKGIDDLYYEQRFGGNSQTG